MFVLFSAHFFSFCFIDSWLKLKITCQLFYLFHWLKIFRVSWMVKNQATVCKTLPYNLPNVHTIYNKLTTHNWPKFIQSFSDSHQIEGTRHLIGQWFTDRGLTALIVSRWLSNDFWLMALLRRTPSLLWICFLFNCWMYNQFHFLMLDAYAQGRECHMIVRWSPNGWLTHCMLPDREIWWPTRQLIIGQ